MNDPFAARDPAPAPPPAARPRPYEFSAAHEAIIASLANLMHIVGAANIALGALSVFAAFGSRGAGAVVVLGQAAAMLLIGSLTWIVGTRFKRISDSVGNDISNLMDALGGLRTMYLVQVWALGLLLGAMALLIGVLMLR